MSIYNQGLLKVKNTPMPITQKYPIGSLVKICKDLGPSMQHFTANVVAIVEFTYEHAFGPPYKPREHNYSLIVREMDGNWYSVAWYYESQLEGIYDKRVIEDIMGSYEYSKVTKK